jgi:hypothetical protein
MAASGNPGPGNEYAPGKPLLSVPAPGQTAVTNALNANTGRYDVFRDGFRIAVSKTAFHAAEISAAAAVNYPNPWKQPVITTFEAPVNS